MENKISLLGEENKYPRYLGYFLILYTATFIFLDFLRLWGFGYGLIDIGVYNQVVWNTANGRFFETSTTYPFNLHANWLAFHFDAFPILFTAAIYKIFPFTETLLVVHVCLVSLTSVIIYKTCRKLEISGRMSFLWSMLYLLHPFTIFHAMFSFQETSFSVFLVALGIYFVICRRFVSLFLVCLLLLFTKEHHGITVFGFGLLWLFYNKTWRGPVVLCAVGTIAAILIIMYIMPALGVYKEHFMFSNAADDGTFNRYSWLRLPLPELLHYAKIIVFHTRNLSFILVLSATFAFMPYLALFFMFPVVGDFLIIILSNSSIPSQLNFYYSAPFVSPGIIATAYMVKKFSAQHRKRLVKVIVAVCIIATFICFGQPAYLVTRKLSFVLKNNTDWTISKQFQDLIASIPSDSLLMTDYQTGGAITSRDKIMVYNKHDLPKADYVLLRISPFDFSPASMMQNTTGIRFATDLVKEKNWNIIYWKYPYVLFAKNQPRGADVDGKDFVTTVTRQVEYYNEIFGEKKTQSLKISPK